MSRHEEGRQGEAKAAAYLKKRGYRIEAKNVRAASGEIDLVLTKGGWLVFVEVKMRKGEATGSPLEAVSPHKVKRLSAAAAVYLAQRGGTTPSCRFDILTLGPDKNFWGSLKIRHYENAFEVMGHFNI